MNWPIFFCVLLGIPVAAGLGCLAAYSITRALYWWVQASEGVKAATEAAALIAVCIGCATVAGLVLP